MTRTQIVAAACVLVFLLSSRIIGWDTAILLTAALVLGRLAGLWLNSRRQPE